MNNTVWFKVNAILSVLIVSILLFLLFDRNSGEIVYVNSTRILTEYDGMKEAQANYNQNTLMWRSQIDTLESELQEAFASYDQEKESLSSKDRERREQLIKNKEVQFIQFQKAIQEKMEKEEQRLQQEVLVQVNSFLQEYGKHQKYAIIMAATTVGNIVYAENGRDITEDVLKGLNAQYND